MNKEIEIAIKAALGYQEPDHCCKTCRFFVGNDLSGRHNAKAQHCKFNPSFDLPVKESGRCNQYAAKEGSQQ